MASSSSSSGRDVLIYLFYHADITHKNSDQVFPRLHSDTKFIDEFKYELLEYSGVKTRKKDIISRLLSESDNTTKSTYGLWVKSSIPCVIKRSDSNPDVDVFYITNTFIANQDNTKNAALIDHIANQRYNNKYIYAVRFCDHVDDFKDVQSMKELKMTISPNEAPIDDLNFFIRDAYPIFDHFFIDDYFKKAGMPASVSAESFYRFVERLDITNTRLGDFIVPCFTYQDESQIDKSVVRDTLINKYTNFFFFPFETYTMSIYVDYMHKIGMPTHDSPITTYPQYPIGDIMEYERMIISDLQRELDKMYLKNTLLEERLAQTEGIHEELIEEQRTRLEWSQRLLQELQGRVRDMSAEQSESITGASSESSVVMRRTKIQELQTKVRELKEEIKTLRTEIRRLQNENANLNSIITQHQDIPEQLDQMTQMQREMSEEVDRLTANMAQKDEIIAELRLQLDEMRGRQTDEGLVASLRSALESSQQNNLEETRRFTEIVREKDEIIARLRAEIEALKNASKRITPPSSPDIGTGDFGDITPPPSPPITGTSGVSSQFVHDVIFEGIHESMFTHLESAGKKQAKSFAKLENQFSRDMFIFA
jgi:outer membrane murein-binding lipoprotein Lpp